MEVVRWALVLAAAVHVAEEWRWGWLAWVRRRVPGFSAAHFWTLNAAFLLLCLVGARTGDEHPVFGLSVAGLLFANALVHLGLSLRLRRYTPGLASAVLLYLPLSSGAFAVALRSGAVTPGGALRAALLGAAWMAVPFAFQGLRLLAGGR